MALRHGSAQISDVFGEKLKGPAELGGLQQWLCAMALRRSSGPAELQQWLCAMLSAAPTSACRAPALALRHGSAQIVDFYALS